MKAFIGVFGAAILASICVTACMAPVAAVVQKARSIPGSGSVAESAAKQGGEHVAHSSASPTPSPSPAAGQSPAAAASPGTPSY
jgi:hypothetical protein